MDFWRPWTASAKCKHFVFLFQPTTPRAANMFVRNTSRNWWDSRKSASWLATSVKRWPIAIENRRNFQLTLITSCQPFWLLRTSNPQPRGVRDASVTGCSFCVTKVWLKNRVFIIFLKKPVYTFNTMTGATCLVELMLYNRYINILSVAIGDCK